MGRDRQATGLLSSTLTEVVQASLRELELEVAAEQKREIELTEAERWARDPIGWINAFGWIASKFAGRRGRVRPMRVTLFPDQEATIRAWIDLELLEATGELVFRNIAIDKSRQIGETWLFALVFEWALHYHVITGLALHQRAAEIADTGWTVKSLMGKIRYIDRRLDPAKVPGLGRLAFHPHSKDPASVVNEQTGSILYGEGQRDDAGRGGSFDVLLADEAAFIVHGESVFAAIDEACPEGKALLSTPNGSDNFHARIVDERPEGWGYLRLHWSAHPIYRRGLHVAGVLSTRQPSPEMAANAKTCELCAGNRRGWPWVSRAPRAHRFAGRLTSPWYDRAVIGKTREQVARELDIDREGSLTARVYDEFETGIHVHRDANAGREQMIDFDVNLPLELGFDYGIDCTAVVICQDAPFEYRVIGEVELVDKPGETPTPDEVCKALRRELLELGLEARFVEPDWTRRIYARGDPSGDARQLATGRPLTSEYRVRGFNIGKPPAHLTRTVGPSIKAVKALLMGHPKPVVVSARCQAFIRHMTHNRWPIDALGKRRVGATTPLDDEHNHMSRAFAYLVVAKFPPPKRGDRTGAEWDPDPPDPRGPSDLGRRRRDRGPWGSLTDAEPLDYDAEL